MEQRLHFDYHYSLALSALLVQLSSQPQWAGGAARPWRDSVQSFGFRECYRLLRECGLP